MELRISIDEKDHKAMLPDNDAVRQLAIQLPLEQIFQRSGEHEFFCRLGRGINVRGIEPTSDIHRNGIYYFDGWKALSFVYKDMSISPYQVVHLGDFTDNICSEMESAGNKITVRLEAYA